MKNNFSELLGPIQDLIAMKDELRKLVDQGRGGISLNTEKFHGKIVPASFRTYQGVTDDFRLFAAGIKGIKNQDLVAQALVEFMEKYQAQSEPPISLTLGASLCMEEEKTQIFSSLVKKIRAELTIKQETFIPQVRIYDSALIGKEQFILKTNDGRDFPGSIRGKSLEKLKSQLTKLMLDKGKA